MFTIHITPTFRGNITTPSLKILQKINSAVQHAREPPKPNLQILAVNFICSIVALISGLRQRVCLHRRSTHHHPSNKSIMHWRYFRAGAAVNLMSLLYIFTTRWRCRRVLVSVLRWAKLFLKHVINLSLAGKQLCANSVSLLLKIFQFSQRERESVGERVFYSHSLKSSIRTFLAYVYFLSSRT